MFRKCSIIINNLIKSAKFQYFTSTEYVIVKRLNLFVRERIRKLVKARDSYGLVFDDVKKMQAMKHLQDVESGPALPPAASADDQLPNSDMAVTPYTDNSLAQRNVQQNSQSQLNTLIRKAPTMPKPKWHPPWKLYRVIAGHLGWVRCVTVEPGNEVRFDEFLV